MASRKNRKQRKTRIQTGSPIRITPRRRKEIDPYQIAMVYGLIASRKAREQQLREEENAGAM